MDEQTSAEIVAAAQRYAAACKERHEARAAARVAADELHLLDDRATAAERKAEDAEKALPELTRGAI